MNKQIGKLYTSNPHGLKYLEQEAEVWQITRVGVLISGAILARGLSPSEELLKMYLNQWKELLPEQWWPEYEKYFLRELETEEKKSNLRTLYKTLQAGKNVVLLCFCKDVKYCHRKLVGQFFEKYDIEVIELRPEESEMIEPRQLTIFDGVI